MSRNPNATVALLAGGAMTLVQWALARWAGWQLPKVYSDLATAAIISTVLYIGRDGVRGALARVWGGTRTVWAGSRKPPT